MMDLVLCTQSWVNRENSRGLRTHPWHKSQCEGGAVANPHSLWSARQEVQDPDAEDGVQTQMVIDIWARHLVFLEHWDNGGLLKADVDYSLGQGQVENVREDACQLVSTHSEDVARDAIWAPGFVTIHSLQFSLCQPQRAPGRPEQRESSLMARYCLPQSEHRMAPPS